MHVHSAKSCDAVFEAVPGADNCRDTVVLLLVSNAQTLADSLATAFIDS